MTERLPVWQQALQLAQQGVPVFPCFLDKTPATGFGGHYNATTDTTRNFQIWFQEGYRLIGIPTGAASGIAVLDVDPKKGGHEWLLQHEAQLAGGTRVHCTRSDGRHLLFLWPEGLRNSQSSIAPGIDVKGEGGYFIWWPTECRVLDDRPISALAPWPDWITMPAPPERRSNSGRRIPGRRSIEAVCRVVATSTEGERNGRLFWSSCRMAEMFYPGLLDEAEAERLLMDALAEAGIDNEREARRTIRSGFDRVAQGG